LSQVLGLQTPFDLDVAQLAVLETQCQGPEESLSHELLDVGEQLFHEGRIWDWLRLNKMVRCSDLSVKHATSESLATDGQGFLTRFRTIGPISENRFCKLEVFTFSYFLKMILLVTDEYFYSYPGKVSQKHAQFFRYHF